MNILKLEDLLELPGWGTRKKILEELETSPKTITELSKKFGMNYSSVRYHLELMEKFGLVKLRKEGRKCFYEITKTGKMLIGRN